MEREIVEKKNFAEQIGDIVGDFVLCIIICVAVISVFVCLAFIVWVLFENPVSLAIICFTTFLIIAWSIK